MYTFEKFSRDFINGSSIIEIGIDKSTDETHDISYRFNLVKSRFSIVDREDCVEYSISQHDMTIEGMIVMNPDNVMYEIEFRAKNLNELMRCIYKLNTGKIEEGLTHLLTYSR